MPDVMISAFELIKIGILKHYYPSFDVETLFRKSIIISKCYLVIRHFIQLKIIFIYLSMMGTDPGFTVDYISLVN